MRAFLIVLVAIGCVACSKHDADKTGADLKAAASDIKNDPAVKQLGQDVKVAAKTTGAELKAGASEAGAQIKKAGADVKQSADEAGDKAKAETDKAKAKADNS